MRIKILFFIHLYVSAAVAQQGELDWAEQDWAATLAPCPPGQGRPSPSEACQLCAYGYYSPGGLVGACLKCPARTVTIGPGSIECGCKPGYGTLTTATAGCRPCPNGTYSPGGSLSPCTRCPGSAYMVTPPRATRVNQCTCKPGYGSTVDFPLSCQVCPIGTYANALAQIEGIPGVPPQGGKGITRGLSGATFVRCTPCCPTGGGQCLLTTKRPGSTSYKDCVRTAPTTKQYCCGNTNCTIPVAEPPGTLPPVAAAADAAARVKPTFREMYDGAIATLFMPFNALDVDGGPPKRLPGSEFLAPNLPRQRITAPPKPPPPSGSSSGGWGSSSGGWDNGGDSWGSSSGGWGSSSGSNWGGGSSSGWGGARSKSWGATISADADVVEYVSGDPGGSAAAFISSMEPVQTWWGTPPAGQRSVCAAHPRKPLTQPTLLSASTPWIVSFFADKTGAGCRYTTSAPLATGCTANQISPNMLLTASHCVDATLKQVSTEPDLVNCQNIILVGVEVCYFFSRQPLGNFQCTNPVDAIGVSYYPRTAAAAPYDQAIIFTPSTAARPGPFYQYNYIENFPRASLFKSDNFTFQALSYSGDGSDGSDGTTPRCGCNVCPSVTCNLARTGPARGPLKTDPREPLNGAVNAQLESCGGSSGSCMTINGQTCCIGLDSYEYIDSGIPACKSTCNNYWSPITIERPLTQLWFNVTVRLPQ